MLASNRADSRRNSPEVRARNHRLIGLGGLVEKSGLAFLLNDNRSAIFGALLEIMERGQSLNADAIQARWLSVGLRAFNLEREETNNA